ncbi:PQQ-binding-like beta-propeller repeat protein [Demequina sp.]|uniref:outer membrane protein assembly factor BamB family protein n=1 Tax=Demequina sp. TaxID=2050685 RepID=UPI003A858B90
MRKIATACLLVALLAGCQLWGSPERDSEREPAGASATPQALGDTTASPEGASALSTSALDVGEPVWRVPGIFGEDTVVADGVVLAVQQMGNRYAKAIDVETGELLWAKPVSRGSVGEAWLATPALLRTDDHGWAVVMSGTAELNRDLGQFQHRVQVRALRTGEVLAEAQPAWMGSLWQCDGYDEVCAHLAAPGDEYFTRYVVDAAKLEFTAVDWEPPASSGGSAYFAGGIWGVERDGRTVLVRRLDGVETWQTDVTDVKGLESAASSGVYAHAEIDDDANVMLMSIGPAEPAERIGLDDMTVVSVDLDSGDVLWREFGAVFCWERVVCRGEIHYDRDPNGTSYSLTTGDVELSVLDPRTGQATWSTTIADAAGIANGSRQASMIGPPGVEVLESGGVAHLLDLETGELQPLGGRTVVCAQPRTATLPEYSNPQRDEVEMNAGVTYAPCTGLGEDDVVEDFTREAVEAAEWDRAVVIDDEWGVRAGTDVGKVPVEDSQPRIHVVATEDALLGFWF